LSINLEHDEGLPLMVRRLVGEARQQLARLDAHRQLRAEIKSHVNGSSPATLALLGIAVAAFGVARRRVS